MDASVSVQPCGDDVRLIIHCASGREIGFSLTLEDAEGLAEAIIRAVQRDEAVAIE